MRYAFRTLSALVQDLMCNSISTYIRFIVSTCLVVWWAIYLTARYVVQTVHWLEEIPFFFVTLYFHILSFLLIL